jgi:hypothetical protein
VFSSGFSKPAIVNELERHHAVRFIHKPYELEELRGALRQVLG